MNARKSLILVLPLVALVLMSCRFSSVDLNRERVVASGNIQSETRALEDVERVSLTDFGELTIIQGSEESLTIEADDNLLPYIETEMRGRELVIGLENGITVDTDHTIRYTLRVKNLSRISVSGSADVIADEFDAENLELSVSGSGNLRFGDLTAAELRASTSGSGNYDLSGKVERQWVTISGAGNYDAADLQSSRAEVNISGAGNVTLWAVDELDVRVTGFGDVRYYGAPDVSQTITGGGSVDSLGDKK